MSVCLLEYDTWYDTWYCIISCHVMPCHVLSCITRCKNGRLRWGCDCLICVISSRFRASGLFSWVNGTLAHARRERCGRSRNEHILSYCAHADIALPYRPLFPYIRRGLFQARVRSASYLDTGWLCLVWLILTKPFPLEINSIERLGQCFKIELSTTCKLW